MYVHGGDIYRNQIAIDFSVNVNPLGTPQAVKESIYKAVGQCGSYPDMEAQALKKAVSAMLAVPEESLLFGNGASELFMALVHAIRPKKTVIPVPSFYGYEYAAKAVESEIHYYELKQENGFRVTKEIERRSFEIISEELQKRNIVIPKETENIVKRVIHTSADFDYAETLCFSRDAVRILEGLIKEGADIVTDTNMALAGINKKALAEFGGHARCFMADEDVCAIAENRKMTRASVSMEKAAEIKKPIIFAIGNAPTALVKLYEMSKERDWKPGFIIGVPVGFVNVEAAKELIPDTQIPYIINRGRKGGSSIAAAICNAVLYQIRDSKHS